MKAELVKYNSVFLDLSWKWLNDKEIKVLTNTPDFSIDEQKKWFSKLDSQDDYLIWGIKYNNKPIGACGLKNITDESCEYWGYIGEKKYWGMGIGKTILASLLGKATQMGKKNVWLKVNKTNERAVNVYKKNGFLIEKESEEELKMRVYL